MKSRALPMASIVLGVAMAVLEVREVLVNPDKPIVALTVSLTTAAVMLLFFGILGYWRVVDRDRVELKGNKILAELAELALAVNYVVTRLDAMESKPPAVDLDRTMSEIREEVRELAAFITKAVSPNVLELDALRTLRSIDSRLNGNHHTDR